MVQVSVGVVLIPVAALAGFGLLACEGGEGGVTVSQ